MGGDEHPGQTREVLQIADAGLQDGEAHHPPGTPAGRRGGGIDVQQGQHPDQQADEQQHNVGVQPTHQPRVQVESHGAGVPGVGPGTGYDGAHHDDHRRDRYQRVPQVAGRGARDGCTGRVAGFTGELDQGHTGSDHRHGQQQMAGDGHRVQVHQHRDPT